MLLSMTGFGESHFHREGLTISAEVRTVNNRYLKLSTHISEGYAPLEPQIESLVRARVRRGTVQVTIRVDRLRGGDEYRLNFDVLDSYRRQLEAFCSRHEAARPVALESLLVLPGVVAEDAVAAHDPAEEWPAIREALAAALDRLDQMRREEGRAMAADLRANAQAVSVGVEEITRRSPLVTEAYRARLAERVQKAIADFEVTLDPADLIREVTLFADRCDISEELVRLRSHLEQFDRLIEDEETPGRKLEFLTQEMLRETNTIGAKANDVEIARHVIDMKTSIERIREMIQNIE